MRRQINRRTNPTSTRAGGKVRVGSGKCAAIAALVLAGVVTAGCSKKSQYGADTTGAAMRADTTTTTYTASSTAPAMQDTTAASTSTSKTSTRKTTKKTSTKKY